MTALVIIQYNAIWLWFNVCMAALNFSKVNQRHVLLIMRWLAILKMSRALSVAFLERVTKYCSWLSDLGLSGES